MAASAASELARKYDRNVPRYTSYPTAPHFSAAVDAMTYADWLAALDPGQPLSLYLHIPFCDQLCWFCGCYTKVVNHYAPIADYLDLVNTEIALIAARLPGRFRVTHLHWGGGSPSLVRAEDWQRQLAILHTRFDFEPDAEIAIELDPREVNPDYIAALAAVGINRVSIGVQDFAPEVQQAINRPQPFALVARVVDELRAAGIEAINLDLMYGLPHQTTAGVEAMVAQALSLNPSRVALFGYAHVPWMRAHQKLIDETALPDGVARHDQFVAAARRLEAAGYLPVGLDHFARPDDGLARAAINGRLHRNFQGYTTDRSAALLGIGASAIGSVPAGYVQNAAPLADYRQAIGNGQLATVRGLALNADDRLRREIIERLMCQLGCDVGALCRRYGAETRTFADSLDALAPLASDGLVIIDDERVCVTETGRPFVRLVAAAFDRYLGQGAARHSRAL